MIRNVLDTAKTALALSLAAMTLVVAAPAFADDSDEKDKDKEEETEGKKEKEEREERKRSREREESEDKRDSDDAGGQTDHDKMVHHVAIGYFGVSDVPVGVSKAGLDSVAAPAIGIRYWVNRRIGIDGGVGMNFPSATAETNNGKTTTTTDLTVPHAFLLHGGVPIAITTTKHAAILVTPEFNLGFGGSTEPADPAIMNDTETSHSGFGLQIGGRAGAEVHFGFMGIPNLSLEGSVGAYVNHVSASTSKGDTSSSFKSTSFGTNDFNNPWDFFKSSVAARYYF